MEVVCNICDKELVTNTSIKIYFANFQNSLPLREIYIKYSEKNSIAIGIAYSYIFRFLENLL